MDEALLSESEQELEMDAETQAMRERSDIVRSLRVNIDQLMRKMLMPSKLIEEPVEEQRSQSVTVTKESSKTSQPHPLYVFSHKEQYFDLSRDLVVGEIKFDQR